MLPLMSFGNATGLSSMQVLNHSISNRGTTGSILGRTSVESQRMGRTNRQPSWCSIDSMKISTTSKLHYKRHSQTSQVMGMGHPI